VTGAAVADLVPSTLTGVTWTSSTTGTASVSSGASGSGNNLAATVNIAAGAGNAVVFTVSGTVLPSATGNLVNTATVAPPSGTTDPNGSNNSASDTDTPAPSADLQITKTDNSATYTPGGPVTYTITVSNPNGPSDVTGAAVADLVPSTLKIGRASCRERVKTTVSSGAIDTRNNTRRRVNTAAGASKAMHLHHNTT